MSSDNLEPQHSRSDEDDVLLDGSLVRPYVIPGVTFVPASEAIRPCPHPCTCCQDAGRQ